MRKYIIYYLMVLLLVSCGNNDKDNIDYQIKVYSRDNSSGTRQAFESIIELESLTNNSAETSGNGDMIKQVGADKNAIGYVSLSTDFEANNLKPVSYENIMPSLTSVISSEYELARPFSFVTRAQGDYDSKEKEQLVIAIIDYLENSKEGREFTVAAGGIVDVDNATPWEELKRKHPIVNQDNSHLTIKTGGSTSVDKTVSRTVSSFIPMAGNFNFEPNYTGSSDGFKRTLGSEKNGPNSIDIGFSSREFRKNEDINEALVSGVYSKDAIVIVVHKDNNYIDNITTEQLIDIFSGKVTNWKEIY